MLKPYFWTWDHSTNWKKNEHGKQVCGANNWYTKRPEAFLEDYKRLISWSADHGIETIGIAGLLRDCHGGVEAAREITEYAAQKGVQTYEVCGLAAYNGVYYDGESPWCLDNFLKDNPDCLAIDTEGKPLVKMCGQDSNKLIRHACLSKQKTRDYICRSLEWLFKEVPALSGISIETGDTGTCQCPECRKRRSMEETILSAEDMAYMYPLAIDSIRSVKPDALVICETYSHFLPLPNPAGDGRVFGWGLQEPQIQALSALPKDVYISWVADMCLGQWKETDAMPEPLKDHKHLMRAHYGTQWFYSIRHQLELDKIQRMCRLSAGAGMEGVSLFGESSVFNANNELNYLAELYFAKQPFHTVENFLKDVAADLLGGEEAAHSWCMINKKIDEQTVSAKDVDLTVEYAAGLQGEQRRRWVWLGSYAASHCWDRMQL